MIKCVCVELTCMHTWCLSFTGKFCHHTHVMTTYLNIWCISFSLTFDLNCLCKKFDKLLYKETKGNWVLEWHPSYWQYTAGAYMFFLGIEGELSRISPGCLIICNKCTINIHLERNGMLKDSVKCEKSVGCGYW